MGCDAQLVFIISSCHGGSWLLQREWTVVPICSR